MCGAWGSVLHLGLRMRLKKLAIVGCDRFLAKKTKPGNYGGRFPGASCWERASPVRNISGHVLGHQASSPTLSPPPIALLAFCVHSRARRMIVLVIINQHTPEGRAFSDHTFGAEPTAPPDVSPSTTGPPFWERHHTPRNALLLRRPPVTTTSRRLSWRLASGDPLPVCVPTVGTKATGICQ